MATARDWCGKLKESGLFELLRKGSGKLVNHSEAKNYLAVKNGELFVWNSHDATLLRLRLKQLAAKASSDVQRPACQTLLCTNAPKFEVDSITCNETGSHIMLSGRRGVTVMQIPQYRELLADQTADRIMCRCVTVAERSFATSNLQLVHAKWHPGSPSSTHIALLTSDNVIRIYNVNTECDQPEKVYQLGDDGSSGHVESSFTSPSRTAIVLGETAVSFDFGPTVELCDGSVSFSDTVGLGGQRNHLWPIYVLLGNGEVYRMLTSLETRLPSDRRPLMGPLRMYPAAEDNYGSEACSILCLETRPPVLVIATCEGKLHHCLLLNQPVDDGEHNDSVSMTCDSLSRVAPLPALYVYESVELELSLTTVSLDTDESIYDYFSCPIKLHSDTACAERYHCSHTAGLHSLVLPWVHKCQQFYDGVVETPSSWSTNDPCIVEHLVCTKPLRSSPLSPILGVGVVSDRLLVTKLICLTSTLECVILPLQSTNRVKPLPLVSETSSHVEPLPLRQMYHEPFSEHIRKILHRTSSNPLLKSSSSAEPSAQECLQLLVRATQIFREEYIQKLELAREEINKRARILEAVKAQNLQDLTKLDRDREIVIAAWNRLKVKYEEAMESQQTLTARIENILRKFQNRTPILSDAERESSKELKSIESSLGAYLSKINTITSKMEYQKNVVSSQTMAKPLLNDKQMKNIQKLLQNESEEITSLVKQVKILDAHVV